MASLVRLSSPTYRVNHLAGLIRYLDRALRNNRRARAQVWFLYGLNYQNLSGLFQSSIASSSKRIESSIAKMTTVVEGYVFYKPI